MAETILITGTNRGLGLELSRQYVQEGDQVLACCRNPQQAEQLQRLREQFPERLELYPLEVSDHQQIEQLAQVLAGRKIDILLNNAGFWGGEAQSYRDIDYQNWLHTFQINTLAPMKMAQAFLPMLEASSRKLLLNISSRMGSIDDNSSGGYYIYRSSKAALNMLTKSLAVDLKPRGITVVTLHPGWVQTDMGGPNALLTLQDSIHRLRRLIATLEPSSSGKFLAYDGSELPW